MELMRKRANAIKTNAISGLFLERFLSPSVLTFLRVVIFAYRGYWKIYGGLIEGYKRL